MGSARFITGGSSQWVYMEEFTQTLKIIRQNGFEQKQKYDSNHISNHMILI